MGAAPTKPQKRQTISTAFHPDFFNNPYAIEILSTRQGGYTMKQSIGLIALVVFVVGVSFVISAQDPQQGGRPLSTTLSGASEVPGPGDADGIGTVMVTLNHGKGEVCYELTVDKIAAANGAHIHAGAVDKAGPPVMNLTPPTNGSSKGCAPLEKDKIKDIIQNPANYYVNVHNAEFPDGAVRGQLGK
jgi:hypothetical protein